MKKKPMEPTLKDRVFIMESYNDKKVISISVTKKTQQGESILRIHWYHWKNQEWKYMPNHPEMTISDLNNLIKKAKRAGII